MLTMQKLGLASVVCVVRVHDFFSQHVNKISNKKTTQKPKENIFLFLLTNTTASYILLVGSGAI